ncbi:YggS family pyridoxal phosphate-dependent enzyme [Salirhabdus salicampi]|uniref:YggS family pyridoxal phosphate-dependent enzyme n=1 Tax=Salirhabdus salicampi TaxID=476102 RepID=UPI0020C25FF4|nr:YggS family pyridoxal phosphate-dependent enzyme [Salirhabdus salicampi]MCP8616590.1 YggS family pyridoxal phosphate-dependent enzyme [Salirhabdus salicampi]
MVTVKENADYIKQRIKDACNRSNRNPEEITIVAVTKYVSVARAKEAVEAGIFNLGENRQEGIEQKYEHIGAQATWHFIGTLQSRKVKNVIDKVDYIHSLDRLSLAKEIHKRTEKPMPCFVQVNVSGEESKHGIDPEKVEQFVKDLHQYNNINVVGLMTMAPLVNDESILRNCFQSLRNLRDHIQSLKLDYAPCEYLSMGMSNDFDIAIEEGATHIRIGSKLVGDERNKGGNE